jgi:uncharacterized membrane protein YphA (DoxX/SURF4 family)
MAAATEKTAMRIEPLVVVRVVFGLFWLANAWFHAYHVGNEFLPGVLSNAVQGQPVWLQTYIHWFAGAITTIGPTVASLIMVALDLLIAVSLLTGWRVRLFAWIGILYMLIVWSALEGMGGPYGPGATDPGPGIVYVLLFWFTLVADGWLRSGNTDVRAFRIEHFASARILFGLLWAFDVFWKWHPYFITHTADIVAGGGQGRPAWMMAYIGFVVDVIHAITPIAFGLIVAVLETFLAICLLTGRWLPAAVPAGIALTLGIWTTAEGWGGPYTVGSTGMPGDVVGNAVLYTLGFVYLWVAHRPLYARRQ